MSNKPLVSVTMLTYKRKELFKKTLDSFLEKNTYPNMEFLVWVNSYDKEYEDLINSYGNLFTFKCFSKENAGIGAPRNTMNYHAKGKYILNLEDDWECTADPEDNFIERAVNVFEKYPDIGQIILRDVPMQGYSDGVIDELRDDCHTIRNLYANMSPTFTNQVNIAPKSMYEKLGPFTEKNQEDEFGKLYDNVYKSAKLGHTENVGFFYHMGFVSAASKEDSEMLNTYFCGNARRSATNYDHVGVVKIFNRGEEEFVDCMIQEMLPVMDLIILSEPKVDMFMNYIDEKMYSYDSALYKKYHNNPKIKYVCVDTRYFKNPDEPFSNRAHKNPIMYNLGNASLYRAAKILNVSAKWFYIFDGDEVISTENFIKIKEELKNYDHTGYKAFAVPTQLYSKYINGELNKPAFTPLCIVSEKAFDVMEGNRGRVTNPPMSSSDWKLLENLPYNTLHHFSYVNNSQRKKHDFNILPDHKSSTKMADFMDNSLINEVSLSSLPKSVQDKENLWKKNNLLFPPKVSRTQTVCLNMMVKNESINLIRYHAKLANYIDEYLVVDTGSTDDTKHTIRKIFNGIPGTIIDHPFDDYSSCRNDGLDKIKSDWILMLDADHELMGDLSFLNNLEKINKNTNTVDMEWREPCGNLLTRRLIRNTNTYKWEGSAHELLVRDDNWVTEYTDQVYIYHHNTGSGKQNKYERELKLLLSDWEKDQNPRTCFYIGCDYYWSGNYKEAEKWFKTYEKLDRDRKWGEEIYKSHLYLGRSLQKQKKYDEALHYYEKAKNHDIEMAEPVVWSADIYSNLKDHEKVCELLEPIYGATPPKRILWFEKEVYDKTLYLLLSVSSWYANKFDLGRKACEFLIKNFPNDAIHVSNLKFYE